MPASHVNTSAPLRLEWQLDTHLDFRRNCHGPFASRGVLQPRPNRADACCARTGVPVSAGAEGWAGDPLRSRAARTSGAKPAAAAADSIAAAAPAAVVN